MVRAFPLLALLVVVAVGCVSSAAPASAQGRPAGQLDIDERVRALLSGIEDAPGRAELLALGEPGLDALVRLHGDEQALGALRLRAITCVAWFPGVRAHDFLIGILRDGGQDALHLRAAIRALAAREGMASVSEITRHGRHADIAVREAVFLSLATLRAAEGTSSAARAELDRTLESLLQREPDAELVRATRARLRY